MTHVLPSIIAGLIFLTVVLPNPVVGTTLLPVSNVRASTATHTVVPGETLYSIARSYGMTVDALKAINGLTSNVIWVGQKLQVGSSSPQAPTGTYHIVVRGDTLYSLARRYSTTVDAIMQANWLTSPNIYVGQRLIISSSPVPPVGSTTYTVVGGDTLYSIAQRYGTTVEAIKAANGLSGTFIYIGQRLQIPSTRTPIAPTASVPTATPIGSATPTNIPTSTTVATPTPTPTSSPTSPTQTPTASATVPPINTSIPPTATPPQTNTPLATVTSVSPTLTPTPTPTRAWYSGGTLHQATWAEWRQATYDNKLATAADMITNIYEPPWETLTELRLLSDELVSCLNIVQDTAIALSGENSSIVDYAVVCVIEMMRLRE